MKKILVFLLLLALVLTGTTGIQPVSFASDKTGVEAESKNKLDLKEVNLKAEELSNDQIDSNGNQQGTIGGSSDQEEIKTDEGQENKEIDEENQNEEITQKEKEITETITENNKKTINKSKKEIEPLVLETHIDLDPSYTSIVFNAAEKKFYAGAFSMEDYIQGSVDLSGFQSGEYNENTILTINSDISFYGEDGQVSLRRIEDGPSGNQLSIFEGTDLKIRTNDDYGINLKGLVSGDLYGNKKTTIDVSSNKIGMLISEYTIIYGTSITSRAGLAGISSVEDLNIKSNEGSRVESFSNSTNNSQINTYASGQEGIAFVVGAISVYDTRIEAIAENGKGAILCQGLTSSNDKDVSTINTYSRTGIVVNTIYISLINTSIKVRTETANIGIMSVNFHQAYDGYSNPIGKSISCDVEINKGVGMLGDEEEYKGGNLGLTSVDLSVKVKEGIGILYSGITINNESYGVDAVGKINVEVGQGYGIINRYSHATLGSTDLGASTIDVKSNGKSTYAKTLVPEYLDMEMPEVAGWISKDYLYLYALEDGNTVNISAPKDISGSVGLHVLGEKGDTFGYFGFSSFEGDSGAANVKLNISGNTGAIVGYADFNVDLPEGSAANINIEGIENGIETVHHFYTYSGGSELDEDVTINVMGKNNAGILYREKSELANQDFIGINTKLNISGGKYGVKMAKNDYMSVIFDSLEANFSTTKADAVAALWMENNNPDKNEMEVSLKNSKINAKSQGKAIVAKGMYLNDEASADENPSEINAIAPYEAFQWLDSVEGIKLKGKSVINATATKGRSDEIKKATYYSDKTILSEDAQVNENYQARTKYPINERPSFPYAKGLNVDKYENYQWSGNTLGYSILNLNVTNEGITTSDLLGNTQLTAVREEGKTGEPIELNDNAKHKVSLLTYASDTALFNVTFNANGGKFADGKTIITKEDVAEKTKISKVEPKKPVKKGYDFKYWYESDSSKPYDMNKGLEDNLTLYAKWEKSKGDNGGGDQDKDKDKEDGKAGKVSSTGDNMYILILLLLMGVSIPVIVTRARKATRK